MSSPFDPPFDFPLGGPPFDATGPQEVERANFGIDLLHNEELEVTAKGDFVLVTGMENLRRAIWRRLVVRPGEYKIRPDYGVGLPLFVKKPFNKASRDDMVHRIVENLSKERRLDKVIDVKIEEILLGTLPGIRVTVLARAKGRDLRMPFDFSR